MEIVTSQGMDERQAEGQEGNIYRLGQTVRREVIRLNESPKGRRGVGGPSEKTSKCGRRMLGRRRRELGGRDTDVGQVHT